MPHPDHAKNGLWSPAAAPLAGGASYRRQCSWARSRTRPAAADPTPRLVRVRRRCSARKAWPTSDRGLCTPPSATRQIALCRPGRCPCQAIPAVKRRPAPPHPDIKQLESPRDDSAACLELNSSACAGGRARLPDPEPSPLSGDGIEPTPQGAGPPDADREARPRPLASQPTQPGPPVSRTARAHVVPTASAAAHRRLPWQESTTDRVEASGPHSEALEVPSAPATARSPPPPRQPRWRAVCACTLRPPPAAAATVHPSDRVRRWAEPGPAMVSPMHLPMAIPASVPPHGTRTRRTHPAVRPRVAVALRSAAPCAPRGRGGALCLRLRRPMRRSTRPWSEPHELPQLPSACRSLRWTTRWRPSTLTPARRGGLAWLETWRMPGCTTTSTRSSSRVTAAARPSP